MGLNHLQTFESFSDKDLDSLTDFGKSYGIIKRRVYTEDLEFSNEFGEEVKDELDFLDDWSGKDDERITEVSGYVMKDEVDLDISLDNDYHIRFDAMLGPHRYEAVIKVFGAGLKIDPEKQAEVVTKFLEHQTDKGTFGAILAIYEELKY